ncbi:MAG: hypothetical protein EOP84_05055 [Verrucomicrobiaceae bacterium]|nr:MAG: hypothetical protein EOP84_05055 [Verrucomicrobiaceae bacterium]
MSEEVSVNTHILSLSVGGQFPRQITDDFMDQPMQREGGEMLAWHNFGVGLSSQRDVVINHTATSASQCCDEGVARSVDSTVRDKKGLDNE